MKARPDEERQDDEPREDDPRGGERRDGERPDGSAADIGRRARRKQAVRAHPAPSPLRGVGTFGMIGWSVAVPGVGGAFLGLWLDRAAPQRFSWTLALLLGGIVLGALLAWAWVEREGSTREDER